MKRIFIAGAFILFVITVHAQNVGVGTAAPVAKLTIVGVGNSPAIPGTTSTGVFRIGISSSEGIDFGKTGFPSYAAWMQVGLNGTLTDALSLQPLGGNVGIGTISPTAKLHVNGAMKIEGINTLEFGAGVAGKEFNAGKIGYQTFTADALDIVGAGTLVSNRKVNIFAEGGTTFNGPINVGGSTGTVGQVLTSNGVSGSTWTNTAFNNNVRFEVDFNGTSNTLFLPPVTATTIYNLNPAVVFIGPTSFSVSRSGLYHIEGFYDIEYVLNKAPTEFQFAVSLKIGGRNYPILNGTEPYDRDPFSSIQFIYRKSVRFVNEVYISAPIGINFNVLQSVNLGPASFISSNHFGKISGYLISD